MRAGADALMPPTSVFFQTPPFIIILILALFRQISHTKASVGKQTTSTRCC